MASVRLGAGTGGLAHYYDVDDPGKRIPPLAHNAIPVVRCSGGHAQLTNA